MSVQKCVSQDARLTDIEAGSKKVNSHEFVRVSQSAYRGPPEISSVCLREVRITLDKSIVRNYLIAKKKNIKQMTLLHYFTANEASDIQKSNKTETVVGNRRSLITWQSSNTFPREDAREQANINNENEFNCMVKDEPKETQSIDETFINENHDFIDDDHLDIGEEFKYSDFLSRSINPKVEVQSTPIRKKKKQKVLQCDHCGLRTPNKEFLQNHIKTKHSQLHDESGFITCFKCNKKYTTFHGFQAHERVCGTKFYYPCKFCQKKVVYHNMKFHLVSQHSHNFDEKKLNEIMQWCRSKRIRKAAPTRKKINVNQNLLLKHPELKKLVKMFCSKCNLSLEIDERKPIGQCLKCKTALKLQCHKCKKTYSNVVSAITHVRRLCKYKENNLMMEANEEAPNYLDIGEEFKFSEFLSSSENAQMNELNKKPVVQEISGRKKSTAKRTITKPFRCEYCGHRTQKKLWLESHIEHKHSQLYDENGIITCDKCNKKYKKLSMFNFHKRSCGTKFYRPCKFCSKLLTSTGSLRKHVFSQHEKEFDGEKINEILQWSKSKAVRKASHQGRSINAHLPTKKKLFRSYFELNKVIKMFCSKCKVTSERELGKTKIQCLKCDTALTFQCQMCKKTYDRKASLLYHIRWYCKEKKGHIIEQKQSDNSNSATLYPAPMPKKSSPIKKKIKYFYCNDCDYKIHAKTKLLRHIRFHHEGRNKKRLIICTKCQSKFTFPRKYKAHELVCLTEDKKKMLK